jgi:hypothetical protein
MHSCHFSNDQVRKMAVDINQLTCIFCDSGDFCKELNAQMNTLLLSLDPVIID